MLTTKTSRSPGDIVLQGEDMLQTVIDGGRKGPCVVGADGAVIRNFTIQNGTVGILCRNTRLTIDRNLIVDNKGAGIHAATRTSGYHQQHHLPE